MIEPNLREFCKTCQTLIAPNRHHCDTCENKWRESFRGEKVMAQNHPLISKPKETKMKIGQICDDCSRSIPANETYCVDCVKEWRKSLSVDKVQEIDMLIQEVKGVLDLASKCKKNITNLRFEEALLGSAEVVFFTTSLKESGVCLVNRLTGVLMDESRRKDGKK